MPDLTLILGGARGGKSRAAEEMARERGGADVLFIATATPGDDEMRRRIEAHRQARPAGWRTLEAERDLAGHLSGVELPRVVLLDCVTLLVANILLGFPEGAPQSEVTMAVSAEIDALLAVQRAGEAAWIVVSNEVGMGVVPPYPLGRAYRDALGSANQRLAAAADTVILMVAGLPWVLKPR